MDAYNDETLLLSIQEGSHHAFSVLVKRYASRFYRLAYRFIPDRGEAEAIVQEAFLKLWENPFIWQPQKGSQFTTWFYRVVVNQCLDYHKKEKCLPVPEEESLEDSAEGQDSIMMRTEQQALLEKAIAALPLRQRIALNLCFYEEVSNKEAAAIMGIKLKALQSLLMRAKTTLKERLQPYVGGENE